MPEENPGQNETPAADAANRRWKRLMPLLLLLVGFGAGVLASHLMVPPWLHRGHGAEHRMGRRDDPDRRSGRRGGERAERGGPRARDGRDDERRVRRFREQLVSRLELDEAQQAQMDAFIEANRAEASAFWDDTYARYRELRLQFRGQISAILNDAQREAFEAWMSERERNDRGGGSVEEASPEGAGR